MTDAVNYTSPPPLSETCTNHLSDIGKPIRTFLTELNKEIPELQNQFKDMVQSMLQDAQQHCGTDTLNHYLSDAGAQKLKEVIYANLNQTDQTAIQNLRKSIQTMLIDESVLSQSAQANNNVRAETIAMNMQKATEEMESAIQSLRNSATTYQTAVQLEKTGQHVGDVQKKVSKYNEDILAKLASDSMTAKRVATINQQNTIHRNIVTEYMQLCSIFLAVGIVIMFIFSFSVVRSFFRHPYVLMQGLLVVLFIILAIIIIYRVVKNDNHYWMLYQERIFDDPAQYEKTVSKPKCPSAPTTVEPIQQSPDIVPDGDGSCDPEE